MKKILSILFSWALSLTGFAQENCAPMSLSACLDYTLENSSTAGKDQLSVEQAVQSKREVIGALLPQISASSGLTYNIQKTTFAMPNFVNSMMPEAMRDPNAAKYMIVTMGMDLSANWGVSLTQQILNFSLFNALEMAKAGEEMAKMGSEANNDDLIAKTATLFYNAEILEYSMGLFDESLAVMERLAGVMEANREIGLVRNVDADRISITKVNLETEKQALLQAVEIQKSLLKLQMGFPMDKPLELETVDIDYIETMVFYDGGAGRELEAQSAYRMFKQQQNMLELQKKAAIAECLPMLSFSASYSQNYMGDQFHGETFHHFPVSMVGLNLRVPIFTGLSKTAKVKKADLEIKKSQYDEATLRESLTMGYANAMMQLEQNRNSIESQRRNKDLAEEVLAMTESNYNEGIATLSDLLNASSTLVQAQMNYVSALGNCVKAWIDLKKANGTINDLKR